MTIARIVKPGLQTTVQDAGREGFRHLGVPRSGAADRMSLALANALVGNPWNAAALECTLKGPTLTFERPCVFALSGADMRASLKGKAVSNYARHEAKAGDELALGSAAVGARTYVAFAGGVAGDEFLGSISTYLPARLGGVRGRALRVKDALEIAGLETTAPVDMPASLRPVLAHDWVLRAVRGPDFEWFGGGAARAFFSAPFAADKRGDRMGLRLVGPPVAADGAASMKSGPVFPGTLQAPSDGAPFLLLADAQTAGGYPRIAQVIDADLHLAGQIRPGDRIWFREISTAEARDVAAKKQALIASFIPGFRLG